MTKQEIQDFLKASLFLDEEDGEAIVNVDGLIDEVSTLMAKRLAEKAAP